MQVSFLNNFLAALRKVYSNFTTGNPSKFGVLLKLKINTVKVVFYLHSMQCPNHQLQTFNFYSVTFSKDEKYRCSRFLLFCSAAVPVLCHASDKLQEAQDISFAYPSGFLFPPVSMRQCSRIKVFLNWSYVFILIKFAHGAVVLMDYKLAFFGTYIHVKAIPSAFTKTLTIYNSPEPIK